MNRGDGQGRGAALALGLALSLAVAGASLRRPSLFARLDDRYGDALLARAGTEPSEDDPLVVALDEEALARFGRWPWPRALVARLLDRLAALHPRAVGVDVLFAEPEQPQGESEGERDLVRAVARGPFVLGYELTFGGPRRRGAPPEVLHPLRVVSLRSFGAPEPGRDLWQPDGAVPSLPALARAASGSGFFNSGLDPDGVLRRVPLLLRYRGEIYPSLALATVLGPRRARQAVLAASIGGGQELRVAEVRIPLDDRGRLLVRFGSPPPGPPAISAAAVLDGRVPPQTVEGRVVFVGATAAGLGESVSTPSDPVLPGVRVHAAAAANLLRADFARPSPPLADALLVLAAGSLAALVCSFTPPLRGAGLLALGGAGLWWGCAWLFRSASVLLSPVMAYTAMAANFALLTLWRSKREERRADRRTRDLVHARDFLTESLASLAEIRHTETGAHIQRTQRYLRLLCVAAAEHPRFRGQLDAEDIELLSRLAPLHDIGKVGVPDGVLLKPHRLTPEEFETVKRHAAFGREVLARAEARAGVPRDEFLQYANDLVYSHHEHWDGTGYPQGLRGDDIPLAGRLMAVVDVYDALVTRRVYKDPVPHEEAVRIIAEGRGTRFDPDLVDAFLGTEERWRQVSREFGEPADPAG